MQSGQEVKVHYVRSGLPLRIEEHFDGDEHLDDFILAQALQDQETYYKSFETSCGDQVGSSSTGPNGTHHQSGDERRILTVKKDVDEESVKRQFAIDEALAIALQEMENLAIESSSNRTARSEVRENPPGNNETNSTASTSQVVIQDDIDPDNMTYEELQSLGEAIGTQCKGLSDELISYLESSKYKTGGLFSRNKQHDECVICCTEYKRGDSLITLPCKHFYHADCASRWLRVNKVCPVCYSEVFGS
ncbi:E3 ubiquitin ligase BIG BROTHER-related-like isoform X2 [Nymphaea colorata]|uniref:E3 ubiquitin ligase BIG BROTHER-related-like isoform X2 n=1 Tax=Nymphaea colorata TaxID=210225 RepID=UPI00129E56E4|nr:E3 ubiquitin ligase BIG BROTHER-related-like isoform X2 [Nymphaea colorata]